MNSNKIHANDIIPRCNKYYHSPNVIQQQNIILVAHRSLAKTLTFSGYMLFIRLIPNTQHTSQVSGYNSPSHAQQITRTKNTIGDLFGSDMLTSMRTQCVHALRATQCDRNIFSQDLVGCGCKVIRPKYNNIPLLIEHINMMKHKTSFLVPRTPTLNTLY